MKKTRLLMGMPITVEILDPGVTSDPIDSVFAFFGYVDDTFSTYKETSEISRLNRGEIGPDECSADVREILALSEETRRQTEGYFDIVRHGMRDPSGIVKGWAIQQAADRLTLSGRRNFYIDAGGDVQVSGLRDGRPWRVGVRNPFRREENVKILELSDCGVATSGTAIRGQHIYDPFRRGIEIVDVVSLTVVGPRIYDADRFATAAFAMGKQGIAFIEAIPGLEGYLIDASGMATLTSGFEGYVLRV